MRVAVVDDQKNDSLTIKKYLDRYRAEEDVVFQVDVWNNSLEFVMHFKNQYAVALMDIEMPGLDGMEVARELRKMDEHVGIIFITNMAQYAIRGYEVNAIDFLVKPVSYGNFKDKMSKALIFAQRHEEKTLLLAGEDGILRVDLRDIWYIEKDRNNLLFSTARGVFRRKGTMKEMQNKLSSFSFAECNSGCLVNVIYVDKIDKDTVYVKDRIFPLSRRMKKAFIQKMMDYIGDFER